MPPERARTRTRSRSRLVATSDDLLAALSRAAREDVSARMRPYLDQPGVPLVLPDGTIRGLGAEGRWWIPPVERGHPDPDARGYHRWKLGDDALRSLLAAEPSTLSPREALELPSNLRDPLEVSELRSELLVALGVVGEDPEVVASMSELAHAWLSGSVDPALVEPALAVSVATGDPGLVDDLLRVAREDPARSGQAWRALRHVRDPALLDRTLPTAFAEETPVGAWWTVLGPAREHPELVAEWLATHAQEVRAHLPAEFLAYTAWAAEACDVDVHRRALDRLSVFADAPGFADEAAQVTAASRACAGVRARGDAVRARLAR